MFALHVLHVCSSAIIVCILGSNTALTCYPAVPASVPVDHNRPQETPQRKQVRIAHLVIVLSSCRKDRRKIGDNLKLRPDESFASEGASPWPVRYHTETRNT